MPKSYTIKFKGRKNGASGIVYNITQTVSAEDQDKAVLKLYDKYEHI